MFLRIGLQIKCNQLALQVRGKLLKETITNVERAILENSDDSRILFGNFQDRPLTRHQHTLVMEPLEHPQGTVGHDDLILSYLETDQLF